MRQLAYFVRNIPINSPDIRRISYHETTETVSIYFFRGPVTHLGNVTTSVFESLATQIEDTDSKPEDCLLVFFAENAGTLNVL